MVQRTGTTRAVARLIAATLALAFVAAMTLHGHPAVADVASDHAPVAAVADGFCGTVPAHLGTSSHCAAPSLCCSLPAEHAASAPKAPARPRLPYVARMLDTLFVSPLAMPPRSLA